MSKTGEVVVGEINKERNITIVGDFMQEKPFMVVEFFKGENHYVGHKILHKSKTEKEARDYIIENNLNLNCSTREPEVDSNSVDVCGGNTAVKREGEELC